METKTSWPRGARARKCLNTHGDRLAAIDHAFASDGETGMQLGDPNADHPTGDRSLEELCRV